MEERICESKVLLCIFRIKRINIGKQKNTCNTRLCKVTTRYLAFTFKNPQCFPSTLEQKLTEYYFLFSFNFFLRA